MVSALYAYSQHGDPYVRSLVTHLLNQVGKLAQFPLRHRSQYTVSFKWRGKTWASFSCELRLRYFMNCFTGLPADQYNAELLGVKNLYDTMVYRRSIKTTYHSMIDQFPCQQWISIHNLGSKQPICSISLTKCILIHFCRGLCG